MVELKVLYFIVLLSLLALSTVLSVKRTKNTLELAWPWDQEISKTKNWEEKIPILPSFKFAGDEAVKLLQPNVSRDVFTQELSKLKSTINTLKQKMNITRRNHKTLMRRIPQKCLNIKCPFEENPICVKFTSKDGKHRPFYVNLINDCEMRFMQCRKGLEATIVASKNCHAVLDIINKPLLENKVPPLPALRRSKRGVKKDLSGDAHKLVNLKDKSIIKKEKAVENKQLELKSTYSQDALMNDDVHKLMKLKGKTVKKKHKTIENKQLELKSKKSEEVNLKGNIKKVKLLNKAKIPSQKILPLKSAASKALAKKKSVSGNNNNSNSKNITPGATETTLVLSAITTATEKIAALRSNTKSNNSKNQKISIGHKDLRASKEYFEKNVGDDKMFTHDVFKKSLEDIWEVKPEPAYVDNDAKLSIKINDNENSNDEPIEGEADIDDKNLELLPLSDEERDPLIEEITDNDNEPSIDATIGIDVEKQTLTQPDPDQVEPSTDNLVNTSLSDDKAANEEIVNMFDDKNPTQDEDLENKDGEVAAHIKLKASHELTFDPNLPLVEEPEVEGDRYNDNPDDYVYVPKEPPIIMLPNDESDDYEDQPEHRPQDDTNVKPEESEENPGTTSAFSGGENNTPETEYAVGSDYVYAPDDGKKEYYPPSGYDNEPETKNENDYEGVDRQEMESDCPRECPAQSMMVCAMCDHGIYRTFLSVCHMRMFSCKGPHKNEKLYLISRYPCVMSAPLITNDPPMQPKGRLSDPMDHDRVLRFIRCKEKGQLEKNLKCTFDAYPHQLSMKHNEAETSPFEY